MRTEIVKWGNSQGVRLPKYLLESIGLGEKDKVEITTDNQRIIIEKSTARHKTIQERFANFDGKYEPVRVDWGAPQGEEIW